MLFDVIRQLSAGQQVDFSQVLAQVLSVLFVILCILPLHEFAHGWVAWKLGDPTAKLAGRLTLNPLASVDPMGALALLLFGFGWAKPVPVDSRYFKKPKQGMALTALAGPVANLLAALAGALVMAAMEAFATATTVTLFFFNALYYYVLVNISLAVFNLLPIPPLDGSRILGAFLSDRMLSVYYRYQNVCSLIVFVLILSGAMSGPLYRAQTILGNAIFSLAEAPFRAFGVL